MNDKLCGHRLGIILALVLGGIHFLWVLLVASGFAKLLMDWILTLHSLNISYSVLEFNLMNSVILVVFTAVCGYICGYIIAGLWNWSSRFK